MKQDIIKRLTDVRKEMNNRGVDAMIILHTDPHQSEYMSDHWQLRRYLSGFTGSAGTLVVTADHAVLRTDSRYFIQAEQQLAGTGIQLMKDGLPETPSIVEFLASVLPQGAVVGVDGMLLSALAAESMEIDYKKHGLCLRTDVDVADAVWPDRPALPDGKVYIHDVKYAGEDATSKINRIRKAFVAQDADMLLLSALDEIAWILNIRCDDVKYNPVTTSYLLIGPEESVLFVDPVKIDDETSAYLSSHGVKTRDYKSVKEYLGNLDANTKVAIDKKTTSSTILNILGDRAVAIDSVVAVPKACRNEVQIKGIRNAMERDGAAMAKALMELEEAIENGEVVTELDFDRMLRHYRSQQPLFVDESFGTIVGYGAHGAIVHYEADEESNVQIKPSSLLLFDSGAQYLDGTTDITRTICLGTPTDAEKHDFTLVMKGHIALDAMIYPVGTRGAQLDAEARKYLWREGLSYLHGTGHGVGHFLNVHEGPQTIRLNDTPIPLMEGMVTSNEPGLYRENQHGVRCENLVLTVKAFVTEFGEFLKFETLTLFPFDLKLFETEIMSDEEIKWVNDYHAQVRKRLSPLLDEKARKWLEEKTAPLSNNKKITR